MVDKISKHSRSRILKHLKPDSGILKTLENIALYGLPAVVSINRFTSDSDEELALEASLQAPGAKVALSEGWAKGGEGHQICNMLWSQPLRTFMAAIHQCTVGISKQSRNRGAKKVYGAGSVVFQAKVLADIKHIRRLRAKAICRSALPRRKIVLR